jgi:RNA polymerase sigma-70 factor, ECF subfamily
MTSNEDSTILDSLKKDIRNGDLAALARYLEVQKGRLCGLLRYLMGEHLRQVVEVEDLFQEVSKSALVALPRIPKEDLEIDPWLDRLARRRVIDAHRQHFGAAKRAQGRNQIFSQMANVEESDEGRFEQMLIASITSPSLAASRNWRLQRLQAAIDRLPEEHARMIRMRYLEGASSSEIAKALNKTDVAVRVALSRIVAHLQSLLVDADSR